MRTKRPIIAVDIDEVLFPWFEELINLFEGRKIFNKDAERFAAYEVDSALGLTMEEANDFVHKFHLMDVRPIHPLADAVAGLEALSRYGSLVVVTSRDPQYRSETVSWLEHHFPGVFDQVVLAGNRYRGGQFQPKLDVCRELGASWLIDDHLSNVIPCAEGGISCVLFGDYRWNQCQALPSNIERASDWREVPGVIERAMKKCA